MSQQHENNGVVVGYFEPELRHTFLPGCRGCGGSHPMARKPIPVNTTDCPDCGDAVLAPGQERVEVAVLGGSVSGYVARVCLSLGKALTKLSKRI